MGGVFINTSVEIRQLIIDLLKSKKINISKMLSDLNFNQSLISDMGARRNAMPAADKLASIAEYLDVSLDYLIGRTDNPSVKTDLLANNEPALSLEHKELIELWDRLDELEQAEFKGELVGYIRAKKK